MRPSPTLPRVAAALLAAAAVSTACSSAPGDEETADGRVAVRVAMNAGLEQAAVDAFTERVAQFEQANPDIDIQPQEYTWTATSFTAQLAGGTIPDVFNVPYTDGRGLIERKQIADISAEVAELPYAGGFNPAVAAAGQAPDGAQWALPIAAYGQALHYNRTLFTEAGLDPDEPPTTWAELRAAAKRIAERTGQTGYAQMTSGNTGGWVLTTLAYAFGGRTEQVDGENARATIDTPEMAEVLRTLRAMRWDDKSMGANFLLDWGTINQEFAAGRIGMYVTGSNVYSNLATQNGLKPEDYGVTVLPLADAPGAGVLGGGDLAVVSPHAGDRVKAAAVKWIDFHWLSKLADQEAAVLDAKTQAESGQPVGAPELPVFDRAAHEARQQWIAEHITVPVEQMAPYTTRMFDQPLVAEPTRSTQDVYGILDTVVQTVLTEEGADIAALLARADADAQAVLDRG